MGSKRSAQETYLQGKASALQDVFFRGQTTSKPEEELSFKLPASQRIKNGTLVPALATYNIYCMQKPTIEPRDIQPADMASMTAMRYDLEEDGYLRDYLQSKAIATLKRHIPNQHATIEAEEAFLERLSVLTNQQFSHTGFSNELQDKIHQLDYVPCYQEAMGQYQSGQLKPQGREDFLYIKYLKQHQHQPWRLLGDSMRRGIAFCCHLALLNKVTLDYLDHPGLTISYKSGLAKKDPKELFELKNMHVWNMVRFPSGRKYMLESTNHWWAPASHPDVKASYLSINRLIKNGNPNLKPAYPSN